MPWHEEKNKQTLDNHRRGLPAIDEAKTYWERCRQVFPDFNAPRPVIVSALVSPGQAYWKIAYIGTLPGSVNNGNHHVYIDAIDETGKRIIGTKGRWGWEGMSNDEYAKTGPFVVDKPANEFGGNVAMTSWGQLLEVTTSREMFPFGDNLKSDRVVRLHHGYPALEQGNYPGHTSHYVVFLRVPATAPGPPPDTVRITARAEPEAGGRVSAGGHYAKGQQATMIAWANEGYRFDGWYVDEVLVSSSSYYTFAAGRTLEIIGKFAENGPPPGAAYRLVLSRGNEQIAEYPLPIADST